MTFSSSHFRSLSAGPIVMLAIAASLISASPISDPVTAGEPTAGGRPFVILATGQSNMALTPGPYVWAPPLNLVEWNWDRTAASTGTAFLPPGTTEIGTARAFAARIAEAMPDRPVHLVNISWGGMPITHWLPGAPEPDLYAAISRNVSSALVKSDVPAVDLLLWWQGESDAAAGQSGAWPARFEAVLRRLGHAAWFPAGTPVVMFGVTSRIDGSPELRARLAQFSDVVRARAAAEPDRRTYVHTADIDEWSGGPNLHVHMTPRGYDIVGRQAAEAWLGRERGDPAARTVASGAARPPLRRVNTASAERDE